MTINEWEKTYGARRRAIDRKLLAEVERQITAQERATLAQDARLTSTLRQSPKTPEHNPTPASTPSTLDEIARNRIAKAFGRAPG
jgi:hypothetical protein